MDGPEPTLFSLCLHNRSGLDGFLVPPPAIEVVVRLQRVSSVKLPGTCLISCLACFSRTGPCREVAWWIFS
jgi:hypothetical protein